VAQGVGPEFKSHCSRKGEGRKKTYRLCSDHETGEETAKQRDKTEKI
jgi:hypothetical protein